MRSNMAAQAEQRDGSRLTREDWVEAATRALAEEGLFAVNINALADRLGVTKGSFYAHFTKRDELIEAVLDLFHSVDTDDVIASAELVADPRARLSRFLEFGFERHYWGRVFAALCAVCSDPRVEPVMRRVAEERMGFLERALREIGLTEQEARERAILIYATYVGFWRLVTAYPDWGFNNAQRLRRYSEQIKALIPTPDGATSG